MTTSRRRLAAYVANGLSAPDRSQRIQQAAAWLTSRHRTSEIGLLARDVAELVGQSGYVAATVTSAHKLSESAESNVKAYIQSATSATEVELAFVMDPSLKGGLKITLPDRELDTTVSTKLHTLVTELSR